MACRSTAASERRPARVHPRAYARAAAILLTLAVCVPLHGLWRLFAMRSPWPRRFLRCAGRACGADVAITGTPCRQDVLFIANHVSWLDILVLAGRTGTAYVAMDEMIGWPLLGWMATLNNSVFVARDAPLDVPAQAASLKRALATHQPLTLFPEGTTGNGATLLPFRSSLVAAVAPPPPGAAIQPVAIDYGADAASIAWTEAEAIGSNAWRVLSRPGRLRVTLHFLPPLRMEDAVNRKVIAAQSREAIARVLASR